MDVPTTRSLKASSILTVVFLLITVVAHSSNTPHSGANAFDSIPQKLFLYTRSFVNIATRDTFPFTRIDTIRTYRPVKRWPNYHAEKYEFDGTPVGVLYLQSAWKIGISHAVSLAFLFSSSKKKNNWEDGFGSELFRHAPGNLQRAFTEVPAWDKDGFQTNYIEHPYAGSFYYNCIRNKGGSFFQSFGYAAIGSTLFEYVTEGMFEQPSIQDLVTTPVLGSLMGEGVHKLTMRLSRNGFTLPEKVIVLIANPSYWLNHGFKYPNGKNKKTLQLVF